MLKRQVQKSLRRLYWRHIEHLISDDATKPPRRSSGASSKQEELRGWESLHSKTLGNSLQTQKNKSSFSITNFVLCSVPEMLLLLRSLNYVAPPKPDLPEYTDCKNINITEEGVKKLLLNLDPNKACGPDGISPRLLKIVAEEVTPALTLLFRNSYQTGTLPLDWKLAHITSVFKKGEQYKAENYHPISLTCIACKVMEHIIASHIMSEEQHSLPRAA